MKKIILILLTFILIFMICSSIITIIFLNKTNDEYKHIITKYNDEVNKFEEIKNKIETNYNIQVEQASDVIQLYETTDKEHQSLEEEITKLKEKNNSLSDQEKTLNAKYNELLEIERKKHLFKLDNVRTINQYNIGFPTGCESVALTILLNYYNVNVSTDEIVNILPKGSKPYTAEDGKRYGGNPYIEFIGDPRDEYSFGVYDDPIRDVANQFKAGIKSARGKSLSEIIQIVKKGSPVLVWGSNNMQVPYISQSWIYKPTGETINWLKNLHAMVIIGVDYDNVIVSDPINGQIRYFNKSTFENRYNAFGKRALYYE